MSITTKSKHPVSGLDKRKSLSGLLVWLPLCLIMLLGVRPSWGQVFQNSSTQVDALDNSYYGLPAPSMEHYAQLWEQLTGIPYNDSGSILLVGDYLGGNEYELWAFQLPKNIKDDPLAVPVGTISVHEQYEYTWILPFMKTLSLPTGAIGQAGNGNTQDMIDFRWTLSSKTASVDYYSNIGDHFRLVVDIATTQIDLLDGTGVSGSVMTLMPWGIPDEIDSAAHIAELIATFPEYKGDVIDPSRDSTGNNAPPGGNGSLAVSGQGSSTDADDEKKLRECIIKCNTAHNTAVLICKSNCQASMHGCWLKAGVIAGPGCVAGVTLCGLVPMTAPACCATGATIGFGAVTLVCRGLAAITHKNCLNIAKIRQNACRFGCKVARP